MLDMKKFFKTHHAGLLSKNNIGEIVILNGWVQKRRNFGSLVFIDLRDASGIVQLVIRDELLKDVSEIRTEFVIAAKGEVISRNKNNYNLKISTGEIEVVVQEIEILNVSKTTPFEILDGIDTDESIRMKYRYLDLRRPEMKEMIFMRSKVMNHLRNFLANERFVEIETPILTKSTPEGARDYLVPSREHNGEFYALPQSPQLFKQLLMVSGFERYFQIARCFRDEDLRSDRQPEFTQLDIEQSFMSMESFQILIEEMIASLFKDTLNVTLTTPFQRMTYDAAMNHYGSDKPDLRYGLEMHELKSIFKDSSFGIFQHAETIKGILAKGGASFSRKEIDSLEEIVKSNGGTGLIWINFKDDGTKSNVLKYLRENELQKIRQILSVETGDLVLISAGTWKKTVESLGSLRPVIAKKMNLIDENLFTFSWITEFPLLEYDEEEKRYIAMHHPFTSPMDEDIPLLSSEPGKVRAKAYDLVLNGFEIGGGSMRIYQRELQNKMFSLLGFTMEKAYEQFGFLLEAFEYGAPPHGGMAFGIDRLLMIMGKKQSIRDAIAFPKNRMAKDIMTNAPSTVDDKQLDEINIKIKEK
jgi:aspartyl-tRNA synthetase